MKRLASILLLTFGLMGCSVYYASKYPLHNAAYRGKTQEAQAFIKSGVPIESRDRHGMTPLLAAASSGYWDTVRMLTDMGANINTQDSVGWTPLLYAVSSCRLDMVRFLAERGARTDVKLEDGTTALHYTGYCYIQPEDAFAIINILLEKGCDISSVDNQGHSVLWHAMEYQNMDMVAMLRKKGMMERYKDSSAGDFDEWLRSPSRIIPSAGAYSVPAGQETAYQLAIEDCNHLVISYKKGLLMVTGPVGYGIGLLADQVRAPAQFQACMEKMGFRGTNK